MRRATKIALVLATSLFAATRAHAQYTDRGAIDDLGGPKTFAERREALAKEVKAGRVVLFARMDEPEDSHYREDNDFYYFTGIQDPGAVVVINAETGRATLFEPLMPARRAQFMGPNVLALKPEQQRELGYESIFPITALDAFLGSGLQNQPGNDVWVRLGFPDQAVLARSENATNAGLRDSHPYTDTPLTEMKQVLQLRDRFPMANFKDVTHIVDRMRNIKTGKELDVMRRNGKISAEGDREAIAHAYPGMYQYEIEAHACFYFYMHGAQSVAYPAIVASGGDINTWHYFSNRHKIEPNQLVVFDYAASLDHLTMDVTRTFNISGKFTAEQAKWYAVDLEAQKAIIALLKPGHSYEEASNAGKAVFEKAGIGDQWLGFPGHFVGMATHDVMRVTGPVKAGQVVAVEPIIEFPDKQMHFRVEDTALITDGEPDVLSAGIPKEIADVEKLVGSALAKK
jgi:Xaa-Pro aminopeptidase